MSEKDKKNIPEVHFDGFDEEWEKKKIKDVAQQLSGNGLSKEDIDEDGKHKCILYGHLYTDYGMMAETAKHKTNSIPASPIYSQKGDVLIPSSDTTPTGLARATSINEDGIILGGDINILRPNDNGDFLSLNINANKQKMIPLIKGTTVKHIHNSDIKNIELDMSTSLEEQKKIAEFFKQLDKLIELNEKKVEKLEVLKRSFLEKMFPVGGGNS